jgi:hypothetical protein
MMATATSALAKRTFMTSTFIWISPVLEADYFAPRRGDRCIRVMPRCNLIICNFRSPTNHGFLKNGYLNN